MILLSAKSRIGSRIALSRWGGGELVPYISLMIAMWHLRGMVLSHFSLQLGVNFILVGSLKTCMELIGHV